MIPRQNNRSNHGSSEREEILFPDINFRIQNKKSNRDLTQNYINEESIIRSLITQVAFCDKIIQSERKNKKEKLSNNQKNLKMCNDLISSIEK